MNEAGAGCSRTETQEIFLKVQPVMLTTGTTVAKSVTPLRMNGILRLTAKSSECSSFSLFRVNGFTG